MRRASLVLAAVLFMGLASSASAASEWILWIKHMPRGSDGYWDLWSTYPSRSACEEARRKVIYDSLVREMMKREDFKTEEELRRDTETVMVRDVRRQCLPDSIDPREKKE